MYYQFIQQYKLFYDKHGKMLHVYNVYLKIYMFNSNAARLQVVTVQSQAFVIEIVQSKLAEFGIMIKTVIENNSKSIAH